VILLHLIGGYELYLAKQHIVAIRGNSRAKILLSNGIEYEVMESVEDVLKFFRS